MNEHPFRFSISYEMPRRGETPAVIGAKFLHTLEALSRIDPLLARWKVRDRPTLTSVPLADARAHYNHRRKFCGSRSRRPARA